MEIKGTVLSGLGEGAYYVSAYSKKFKEILGWGPYPGTLNIRAEADLSDIGVYIPSFGTFSGVRIVPCRLANVSAAIVLPDKTRHKGVLEIISERNLRNTLSLKDGCEVTLGV